MAGSDETEFSITFDDNGYFHNTLWSKFHRYKYDRYQNSEILQAQIRMTDFDWTTMQIERPIRYNGEIYHLLAIEGYNPLTHEATIKMIKYL